MTKEQSAAFEEWWARGDSIPCDTKQLAKEAFLAGQRSQVRLPEKKDTNWDNFVERSESTELAFNEGYNAAIDDMRKLNGLENV